MRTDWVALPEAVKTEIAGRLGGVPKVISASSGDHAEIAATVTGPTGKVFVKAASFRGCWRRSRCAAPVGGGPLPDGVRLGVALGLPLVVRHGGNAGAFSAEPVADLGPLSVAVVGHTPGFYARAGTVGAPAWWSPGNGRVPFRR